MFTKKFADDKMVHVKESTLIKAYALLRQSDYDLGVYTNVDCLMSEFSRAFDGDAYRRAEVLYSEMPSLKYQSAVCEVLSRAVQVKESTIDVGTLIEWGLGDEYTIHTHIKEILISRSRHGEKVIVKFEDFEVDDFEGTEEEFLSRILGVVEEPGAEQPKAETAPDGWIEWDFSSKDGPDLPEGARVYVRFRDGTESVGTDLVCRWNWRNDGCSGDIMAYRIVKE